MTVLAIHSGITATACLPDSSLHQRVRSPDAVCPDYRHAVPPLLRACLAALSASVAST